MSHKAGRDFFAEKRDWSHRKDLVLGYYLAPYLPKIATQNRPVMIVDGFAGPGRFADGKPGSPVIICEALETARSRPASVNFRALLIERDAVLAAALREATEEWAAFASVVTSPFEDALPQIEDLCKSHNLFLYLDPFTVSGLSWKALDRVFAQVGRIKSIEVLMNFNVHALGRAACVALGKTFTSDSQDGDNLIGESESTKQTLNDVLGGDWWQSGFLAASTFPLACNVILRGYLDNLRKRFSEVCWHEIKERHAHAIAKYVLVFGSRHPDALELMNDAMAKSLEYQAGKEAPEGVLFETRPESLVPEKDRLSPMITALCREWTARGDVIHSVIRQDFGRYLRSQIRGQIDTLLKGKRLVSESGKSRINDTVRIKAL